MNYYLVLLIIIILYKLLQKISSIEVYKVGMDNLQKYKKYLNLNTSEKKNILCISSGGCNSFDFGLENVTNIYSIDYNPIQIYLCKFKLQCIISLKYIDAFYILAKGYHPNIRKIYFNKIRQNLDKQTRTYWDNNYISFKKGYFIKSYYDMPLIRFITSNKKKQKIMKICNLESVYHKYGLEKIVSLFTKMLSNEQLTSDYISNNNPNHCNKISTLINNENYLLNFILNNSFSKNSCPEYLKETNFYKLKRKINSKEIKYFFINDTVTNFLKKHRKRDISVSYFLDQPEFLTTKEINEQFYELSKKKLPNHLGIFKTTQKNSRVFNYLKNKINIVSIHKEYHDDSDLVHNQNTFLYR